MDVCLDARLRILGLLACMWVLAAFPGFGQSTDTTPPTLVDLTLAPDSIDVAGSAQSVTITLHITDDLSGMDLSVGSSSSTWYLELSGPSGQLLWVEQSLYEQDFALISGTALDGFWEAMLAVPRFAEAGTWYVSFLSLEDAVGNRVYFYPDTLRAMGFSPEITVSSTPDTVPPELTSLTLTPGSIDTSTGDQSVVVLLGVTDDLSGVSLEENSIGIWLEPPIDDAYTRGVWSFSMVAGTPQSAALQSSYDIVLPQYSPAGAWRIVQILLTDVAGNRRYYGGTELQSLGLVTELVVASAPSDTTAPQLQNLEFFPGVIDTSVSPQSITLTAHVSDDLSGFYSIRCRFRSPSGDQYQSGSVGPRPIVSGSLLDGVFEGSADFPRYAEVGTWTLDYLQIDDRAGNYALLDPAQFSIVVGPIPEAIPVPIDIAPKNPSNTVSLSSDKVSVAILSTFEFDAAQVDAGSLRLAGAGVKLKGDRFPVAFLFDVDEDGLPDLLAQFDPRAMDLTEGTSEAVLTGSTLDNRPIRGADMVRVVP